MQTNIFIFLKNFRETNLLLLNKIALFCVMYSRKIPLEKTKHTKQAQPNTYIHHTHTYTPNKQTEKSQKNQFPFLLQSYMKSKGQVVATCGSVPKAV